MKISIKREDIIALLFLLPYVENNTVANIFNIVVNKNAYIKAIVVLIASVSWVFLLLNLTLSKKYLKRRFYNNILLVFSLYLLMSVFQGLGDKTTSICTWLWINVPIFYSVLFIHFCRMNNYDYEKILVSFVRLFSLFVLIAVLYNIPIRRLFIDPDVRLNPRGGGAVIFGYTIALMFSLCLFLKERFSPFEYYTILIIYTIGALATKSRASVWPVFFLWFANYFFRVITKRKVIIYIMLVPIIFALSTIDFTTIFNSTSTKGWARLFNVHSMRRAKTVQVLLEYVRTLDIKKILFGSGLGKFFPYMYWDLNVKDVENNMFLFDGKSLLVQPHNSFLFFLTETGVIGVGLFISLFILTIKNFMENKFHNKVFLILVVGVIILVNNMDSIFFVQPGVAANYWIILSLMIEVHLCSMEHSYEKYTTD